MSPISLNISLDCLEVAQMNKIAYNINNLILLEHNILIDSFTQKFDLIVSNPPYITQAEYNTLPIHIKEFEPQIALTDFKDGLVFYKRFADLLPNILNFDGVFICELGSPNLIPYIKKIFFNAGYTIRLYNDLNKAPRFLAIIP